MFIPEYAIEIANGNLISSRAFTPGDDVSDSIKEDNTFECNDWLVEVETCGSQHKIVVSRRTFDEAQKPYKYSRPLEDGTLMLGSELGRYRTTFSKSTLMSELWQLGINSLLRDSPDPHYETSWSNLARGSGDFTVVVANEPVTACSEGDSLQYKVPDSVKWAIIAENDASDRLTYANVTLVTVTDDMSKVLHSLRLYLQEHDLDSFRDLFDLASDALLSLIGG